MKVSDVMTPDVITVRADTPVDEIARLLTKHRANAAPVVDDEFHVILCARGNWKELFRAPTS